VGPIGPNQRILTSIPGSLKQLHLSHEGRENGPYLYHGSKDERKIFLENIETLINNRECSSFAAKVIHCLIKKDADETGIETRIQIRNRRRILGYLP